MALTLDTAGATMSLDMKGSKSAIFIGKKQILLHGTRNAILAAADTDPPGDANGGPSVTVSGKVFLAADAGEKNPGGWQFGIIQVSILAVYEFIYAGRMDNEGSVTINLRNGYKKNPSLDSDPPTGVTIEEDIFDPSFLKMTRVKTPNPGFQFEYTLKDHPNSIVPKRFENRKTNSPNFIFSARRDEGFISYFVARETEKSPIQFLSRVGWHAIWHGTFKWSAAKMQPTLTMKHSRLDAGSVLLGQPVATDPEFMIAKAHVGPTANEQDIAANDDAWVKRKSPVCTQASDRPKDLPDDFFS